MGQYKEINLDIKLINKDTMSGSTDNRILNEDFGNGNFEEEIERSDDDK